MRNILLAFALFALLAFGFTWKVWVKGNVPFPGDLLVGAYYPWRTNDIPIKNPLISDVFSQIFPWKKIIGEELAKGRLPLWNPYTLSGYPLLANLHSGALYPLNVLILGNFIKGWNWLLWWQLFGSGCFMFLYLRSLKYGWAGAVLGGIGYAYSGFSLVMWQLVHAGHALMWLPLVLMAVERKKWIWVPILFFPLISAGHFQMSLYSLILVSGYMFLRLGLNLKSIVKNVVILSLTLGVAAIQLLPTLQMTSFSVRNQERYIANYNYGLLPFNNLARLVAPDFFGNPVTGNYWGVFNYQETTIYIGVIGIIGLILGLVSWKELERVEKFFLITAGIILLFVTDSLISRFIFAINLPGISTSAASRLAGILALPGAVFMATLLNPTRRTGLKKLSLTILILGLFLSLGLTNQDWQNHVGVITRNLVFPTLLTTGVVISLVLMKNHKFFVYLLMAIAVCDLFRFGWKYNPFSSLDQIFPKTDEINFLLTRSQNFRVDRENDAVLPPNTWEYYGLKSASGYDPMTISSYARTYHTNLNLQTSVGVSRYTVLDKLNSPYLSDYGIKFLMTKNRGDNSDLFAPSGWKKTYTNERVIIWENPVAREIFFLNNPVGDSVLGKVEITKFEPGIIDVRVETEKETHLKWMFSTGDGWKVKVDDQLANIIKDELGFLGVSLTHGKHIVKLRYFPFEVEIGTIVTLFSTLLIVIVSLKKSNN